MKERLRVSGGLRPSRLRHESALSGANRSESNLEPRFGDRLDGPWPRSWLHRTQIEYTMKPRHLASCRRWNPGITFREISVQHNKVQAAGVSFLGRGPLGSSSKRSKPGDCRVKHRRNRRPRAFKRSTFNVQRSGLQLQDSRVEDVIWVERSMSGLATNSLMQMDPEDASISQHHEVRNLVFPINFASTNRMISASR